MRDQGVPDEMCMQYVDDDTSCGELGTPLCTERCADFYLRDWRIDGHRETGGRSVSDIKWDVMCEGPTVSCYFDFGDWGNSHCITIVGWDDDDNTIIIKNSWGRINGDGHINGYRKLEPDHRFIRTDWWEVNEKWVPYGVHLDN
jgi:hypothetical protein